MARRKTNRGTYTISVVAEQGIDGRPLITEARSLLDKYRRQLEGE